MKQLATLLFALMLSAAASAQNKLEAPTLGQRVTLERSQVATKAASVSPQKKITIDEGEHLMGFYTTDDLPDISSGGYLGLPNYPGYIYIGAVFDNTVITEKFIGGEITRFRFAVAYDVTVRSARIYAVDTNYTVDPDALAEIDMSSATIQAGWNDVELPEPITIEEDKYYCIGYEYVQESNKFPIVTDRDIDKAVSSYYGCVAYGTWETALNYSWQIVTGADDLCVQAVVKGGNFSDDDISLASPECDKYVQKGNDLAYNFKLRNYGGKEASSYKLNLAVDGTVFETLDTPLALTGQYQELSGTLALDSSLESGEHTLAISVAQINGNTPTENTDDDVVEATFYTYDGSVERQLHLIENFTSIQCTACPYGHNVLQALMDAYPDKYAWVAIHSSGMGDDPYYLENGDSDYIEYFSGNESYPTAAFDRQLITDSFLEADNDMAISVGFYDAYKTIAATQINNDVDNASTTPVFAPVDIASDYDEASRKVTITVSGEGVDVAKQLLATNRLTIYLTEDGLVSRQYWDGRWVSDYTHNNVLRMIANTYPWGDDINWTSDSSYSNTVTVTLDSDWEADNMYIVAFISGPMATLIDDTWYWAEESEAFLNNANKAKLNDNPTGITAVTNSEQDGAETFYTIDGRRIATPAKGVNIVKTAKGETKKVVVK